jgi:hypothetical protein
MIEIITIISLLLIYIFSDAIMDLIKTKFKTTVFYSKKSLINQWFNPEFGWRNKWKKDNKNNLIKNTKKLWYYLWLYKPDYKEKFTYSSTIFVFLSDFWHFLKFLKMNSLYISILIALSLSFSLSFITWFIILLITRLIYGIIFEFSINTFFIKK